MHRWAKGWESAHLPEVLVGTNQVPEQRGLGFTQTLPLLQDALLVLEVWENKVVILVREGPDAKAQAYRQFMAGFSVNAHGDLLLAITAEAMSGALSAGRRNMDMFGVALSLLLPLWVAARCAIFFGNFL